MFESVIVKGKLISYDMSDSDLLDFLNLPLNTKIYNSNKTNLNQSLYNKEKIYVFRYEDYDRYMVRVRSYIKNIHGFYSFIHNNLFGYAWINFNRYNVSFINFINGFRHHHIKPTMLYYINNENIREEYFSYNRLHNSVGPAVRFRYNNKWQNDFYNYGKKITLEQFCEFYEKRNKT